MDPTIYVAAAAVVSLLLILITLLRRSKTEDGAQAEEAEAPAQAPRREAVVRGGRRGGPRQRMVRRQESDDEDEDEVNADVTLPDGKVGAKKLKKLQEKAEKRAAREADLQEREERKERDKMLDEQRKKEDAKRDAEEAREAEEERLQKEEEERREHEEYLKLKAQFTVDESGTHEEELNVDEESLLQQFINYIKDMKVVMLEDLAAHFKIRTQDAIDRVTTLVEEEKLSGVLDDRGKFIFITPEEYEAVAKFIKQRGRVSITDLAESSNSLINLQADAEIMHQKMVTEAPTEVEAEA